MRAPRATARAGRAGARRAEQARLPPATRAPPLPPRRRTWRGRRPGHADLALPNRGSAPPLASETLLRPPPLPGPERGRPSAPARRRQPRLPPLRPEPDAMPADRHRSPDPSPPPAPDARPSARKEPLPGRRPSAPADAGTGRGLESRPAPRLPPAPASPRRRRAWLRRAREALRRLSARPRPGAAVAEC